MKTKYSILTIGIFTIGLIFSIIFISCSKMNDLHMDYLLEGERVYVGQPDSVHILPGINRVELQYWVSDPKAKKMKVYWNNKLDSILTDIPYSDVNKPKILEIKNLEPKNYSFQIIVYNENWKNPSIPMEVITEVYSEKYLSRLFPRRIEYVNYLTPEKVYVNFYRSTDKSIESVITYTNLDGISVKTTVPNDESSVVLENFKGNLEVTTFFLPFEMALDTLHSVPEVFTEIDVILNKSLFARWNPPGIPYKDIGAAYSIEKIWDNNYFSTFFIAGGASGSVLPLPYDFTFDLGQEKRITRIKQWQRMTLSILYGEQQIKRFELWGSKTPDVTADLSTWTFLGTYAVKKPSDIADYEKYAKEGDSFMIVGSSPVRYIRYRVLELWKNNGAMSIGELNFYSPD